MLAVVVEFKIMPEKVSQFHDAMIEQARRSLAQEEGCHYFDVCQLSDTPVHFLLYELYSDMDAFDLHLHSPHFLAFDQMVSPWVVDKKVQFFNRLEP